MAGKYLIKFRFIFWLTLIIIIGFLLCRAVAPFGRLSLFYDFSQPDNYNFFIGKLTPAERIKTNASGSQIIIGDPVYFSLRTLRNFNQAKITLKYKNPDDLPLLEMGPLVDKVIWRYDLKPLRNKTLDQLALVWHKVVGQQGEVLLERQKKYNTVEEFLANPPKLDEIAVYNYDFKNNYTLPDYKASTGEFAVRHALRGAYQFYVYFADEELNIKFKFSDLNKNQDSDPIELNLYQDKQIIDSQKLADTGPAGGDGVIFDRGNLQLVKPGLPAGVYKIELRVNDDIVTDEIATKQSKLSFVNRLWLADGKDRDIKLITDSNIIKAQTINPASLQNIRVNSQILDLTNTYEQFSFKSGEKKNQVELAKGDVIISGNGVFSFSEETFFNPTVKKVDSGIDINASGINYVLANYQTPGEQDGWQVASIDFDIADAYRESQRYQLGSTNKISFLISLPGLKAEDNVNDAVEIGEIKVELTGRSLWQKIKSIFYD